MKNIVFLGSKKIGYDCFKILFSKKDKLDLNIQGVLLNAKRSEKLLNYCKNHNIKIIKTLDDYLKLDNIDIAISVQYHKILKKQHIEKAKEITINLHMAPLPEYRGCNQFSYAIINDDKEFGTTIHRLEESIDGGAILFEKRFKIPDNCWVKELYNITYNNSIELFKSTIKDIINGNYELIPQKSFLSQRNTSLHFRKEIENLKKINLNWPKEKIEKHIRGTYMPGFEPPYFLLNGEKIHFKLSK